MSPRVGDPVTWSALVSKAGQRAFVRHTGTVVEKYGEYVSVRDGSRVVRLQVKRVTVVAMPPRQTQ